MAAAKRRTRTEKKLHWIKVNNNEVMLRVFRPPETEGKKKKIPAVVMVCGLLWFGDGLLGNIGLKFNDGFGYALAKCGVPCVQIHTPARHIAFTRLMDFMAVLLFPLSVTLPILRTVLVLADIFTMATDFFDLIPLCILSVYFPEWGAWALPVAHLATRNLQWVRGTVPGPPRRNYFTEIAAAVEWTQSKQEFLGSDGRLVLCGYSSGGHCASLYAACWDKVPKFEAVVLISGIYNVHTDAWTGWIRNLLKPVFNVVYGDILGCRTPDTRQQASTDQMLRNKVEGQDWYVLTARTELMGLQPFQDILFNADRLCEALKSKGAKVHRIQCGLNHWTLVFSFQKFADTFCKTLIK